MADIQDLEALEALAPDEWIDIDAFDAWDIGLAPSGDAGSSYRVSNDPQSPYQRQSYVERRGAIDIRCSCLDVVHGIMSEKAEEKGEEEELATLIVLQFRFDARKRARRVEEVDISLEFRGMIPGDTGPEVFAIAPDGNFSLAPTTKQQDIKHSAGGQLGAGAVGGLTATGSLGWEKTISHETEDHCTVIGSRDLRGRYWGPHNSASWTMLENKSTKSGVPPLLRTAILLRRTHELPFQCIVKIAAEVDFRSSIERVFGGKGHADDPVLFDPSLDPTNNLCTYDPLRLQAVDLRGLCDITFRRKVRNFDKDEALGVTA